MAERHPSRTLLLVPRPDDEPTGIDAELSIRCFPIGDRAVCGEVIELTLRGNRAAAPASIVLPLLISDLPVFCRWRGEPPFGSPECRAARRDRRPADRRHGRVGRPALRRARRGVRADGGVRHRVGADAAVAARARAATGRRSASRRSTIAGPTGRGGAAARVAATRASTATIRPVEPADEHRRSASAAKSSRLRASPAARRATCSAPSSTASAATAIYEKRCSPLPPG